MNQFGLELRGVTVKFQYRQNCGFVVFVNNSDRRLNLLADAIEQSEMVVVCYQIKCYDNGSAAIVGDLCLGYDWKQVVMDVTRAFIEVYG